MLARAFIQSYLTAIVKSGRNLDEAKNEFENWLLRQSDAVATSDEKTKIVNDLNSYSV